MDPAQVATIKAHPFSTHLNTARALFNEIAKGLDLNIAGNKGRYKIQLMLNCSNKNIFSALESGTLLSSFILKLSCLPPPAF
jgi:hypothetical protein